MKEKIKKTPMNWGSETQWAANDKYAGKILHIKRSNSLPKQCHEKRDKTLYVLNGVLVVEFDQDTQKKNPFLVLREGESIRIQPNVSHSLSAPVDGYVKVVEISTP